MNSSLRLPLIIACALFIENMDSTVIATSLPTIAQDLGVDPIALKLALTSYLVSLAVFIPISGWVADRVGARTTFVTAIGVFLLGSVLCAVSASLEMLVAARFLQGMGGAMMVPVGRLILLRSIPKSELVQAWNYLTIPALLGPLLGPPLGGFITTYFDWRWIFFINIPIGALGIWLGFRFVPNLRDDQARPFDGTGFVLSGIGLSAAMLGLATLWEHMLSPMASVVCVAAGSAALAAYWFHARRIDHPLLDLRLFRIPTFRAGVLGGSLFRIGHGAVPFLLPLMLQIGFGLSALESGLLTFVSAIGAIFMKTISTRILERWGFRGVLVGNTLLVSATTVIYGFFTPHTPHLLIIGLLFFGGCIRSLQFTSTNAISFADVSARDMSQATGISSVLQQLSMSLGVTLGAYALQAAQWRHGGSELQLGDFPVAFVVVSGVALVSFFYFWRLPRDAGAALSVRKKPEVSQSEASPHS
jgi:EmrB/QacA subfamily drug resistance transporter